jgi:hypothetical protein
LKSEESRLEKLNAQLDIDIANKNVDIKIQKYWEAVKQFDKTLDSINKHRDENT